MNSFITTSLIALVLATPGGKMREAKFSRAALGSGILKSIDGANLIIDREGKTYTVQTGVFDKCTTKIVRRFSGESSLSELAIGDKLVVSGRFTDDAKTIVQACVVRDLSIQKRFGTFVGEVKTISDTGFTMSTISESKGDQSVTIGSATKLVDRRQKTITQAEVLVGHRVLVRGLWNNTNNTITEVKLVKDFGLPKL